MGQEEAGRTFQWDTSEGRERRRIGWARLQTAVYLGEGSGQADRAQSKVLCLAEMTLPECQCSEHLM
jgi:hypothetical protein